MNEDNNLKENDIFHLLEFGQTEATIGDEPDLGATGNIVTRLSRDVPRNLNYTIYCDNFYSSLPLFAYFAKLGIYMLGTFRRDRLPNNPFQDKKLLAKVYGAHQTSGRQLKMGLLSQ